MTTKLDKLFNACSPPMLGVFRIVIGLLFAMHGSQKLFNWPASAGGAVEVGAWPIWWAGLIELVVGILLTVGLFTRIAAILGAGTMAVAYFWRHWPPLEGEYAGFWPIQNGGEPAVMYCFTFLLLATLGAGALAVDNFRGNRN